MSPSVIVPAVAAIVPGIIPSTVPAAVPAAIVPRIVEPRVIPSAVPAIVIVGTIEPGIVPSTVPCAIIRTIEPGIVPSAIEPGIISPVDGGIVRIVPTVPGRSIPRLVGSPGVPSVVIEFYFGNLILRDDKGVDLLTTLHEDGRILRLSHKKIGLFLILGSDRDLSCLSVRSIVDSVLILLPGSIISGVLRC